MNSSGFHRHQFCARLADAPGHCTCESCCDLVLKTNLVFITSGNGCLVQALNQSQLYVIIRKSAVLFGELIFRILSTVTVSNAEPPVLNPLARLMKTILMFPAQVHYDLCQPAAHLCDIMHIPAQQIQIDPSVRLWRIVGDI